MNIERIRENIIKALFYDDNLYERFVLKGGNALYIHQISTRASIDIDVSMENDFDKTELLSIEKTLKHCLKATFKDDNLYPIDVTLNKRPYNPKSSGTPEFWGGYNLQFKLVSKDNFDLYKDNEQQLRQHAELNGSLSNKKIFSVDISRFEFCSKKVDSNIGNFPIYIYSPLMILYEKLRAICQQMDEYKKIVKTSSTGRARDFYDIYSILEYNPKLKDSMLEEENLQDLISIFRVKKVPLNFLTLIPNYRELHRENFLSVENTVYSGIKLESYDFYFDFVTNISNKLIKTLTNLNMLDKTISIV